MEYSIFIKSFVYLFFLLLFPFLLYPNDAQPNVRKSSEFGFHSRIDFLNEKKNQQQHRCHHHHHHHTFVYVFVSICRPLHIMEITCETLSTHPDLILMAIQTQLQSNGILVHLSPFIIRYPFICPCIHEMERARCTWCCLGA